MNRETDLITEYCETHSSPQSDLLYQLERETHLKTLAPQMMSGHLQGRLLSLLSKLLRPQAILEIGTFTGYSALCLAEGLAAGGTLHTIEANEELAPLIRQYIVKAGWKEKIRLHLGDALVIIPELAEQFDLVFIDAGKMDYARYFDLVIDKVRAGGLIMADNVLWSGKVIHQPDDPDAQTLDAFNQMVRNDARVENVVLPLRDGLNIIRKL